MNTIFIFLKKEKINDLNQNKNICNIHAFRYKIKLKTVSDVLFKTKVLSIKSSL